MQQSNYTILQVHFTNGKPFTALISQIEWLSDRQEYRGTLASCGGRFTVSNKFVTHIIKTPIVCDDEGVSLEIIEELLKDYPDLIW